jgi:multiple antibiotic resistance protein
MDWYAIFSLSISLFLLMDSVGNIPLFISILKHIDPQRQKRIIVRELIISLFIILFFAYLGEEVLSLFEISQSTLGISGGIILFMIAVKMIFPGEEKPTEFVKKQEPFIVPLAIPLIAGPAILAAVMIYGHSEESRIGLTIAILISWVATFIVMFFSTAIQRVLKEKGCEALQKLMGLILTLIAVQMFMNGIQKFAGSCH